MLLCEVELGNSKAFSVHHVGMTVHNKWRDAGYIHKGCQVPDVHMGRTTTIDHLNRRYYTSEYVAKDPAQILYRICFKSSSFERQRLRAKMIEGFGLTTEC